MAPNKLKEVEKFLVPSLILNDYIILTNGKYGVNDRSIAL
jgi:hypothetical protein